MKSFNYKALPINVHFGRGRFKEVKEILKEYQFSSVLIITTAGQAAQGQKLAEQLGHICVGVHAKAIMHVPVAIAEEAIHEVQRLKVDCCLALGGGSTIGLAKAIALKTSIPIVAVPTTYAGSEMTAVYGLTENRVKTTGKDLKVLPKVVIYDPELSLRLPPKISACSGMNAMAHAVEALYAQDKNPIITMMALDAIRALKDALPVIVEDTQNIEAREKATYGAWLAGICLGSVDMAIHHKICHTLGGTYNLPHAEAHAISLAYSVHYNRNADIEAMTQLACALGGTDHQQVGHLIYQLNQKLNIPMALKDIGLPEDGPQTVTRIVCDSPYYNPRAYEYAELEQLMQRAYMGLPPN